MLNPVIYLVNSAIIGAVVISVIWINFRRGTVRAWRAFAQSVNGTLELRNSISPAQIIAFRNGRALLIETATSYEDDAGYYHTRGYLPLLNPGRIVFGARRKSLLEEFQTRNEKPTGIVDDAEFERRFILVCNDAPRIPLLLTEPHQRELMRYSDIEIYTRHGGIEWRRSGETSDAAAMARLTELIEEMADTIEQMPARLRTSDETEADEALLEKGL